MDAGVLDSGMHDRPDNPDSDLCRSCGACCAYDATWPRFSTEEDEHLQRIPARLVNAQGSGMRCSGNRCSALAGEIGRETTCRVYAHRPDVCRACAPGDPECLLARRRFGLPPLPVGRAAGGEAIPPAPDAPVPRRGQAP